MYGFRVSNFHQKSVVELICRDDKIFAHIAQKISKESASIISHMLRMPSATKNRFISGSKLGKPDLYGRDSAPEPLTLQIRALHSE